MGKCLPGPQRAPGVYGQTPKLPYNKIPVFRGFLIGSWDAPGRPGKAHGSHLEKWLISAKYFSPGLLTCVRTGIILQDEMSKLPENLENKFRIQEGGSCQSCAPGAAGNRKEENGLVTWITHTIEVGLGPRHNILRTHGDSVTPQTPKLPN